MSDQELTAIERRRKASREWKARNKEKVAASTKAYRQVNPEKHRASNSAYVKRHSDKNAAKGMRYLARKTQAIPSWFDKEAVDLVYASAYELTRSSGEQYHVDHIVPLHSDIVCGLHVHCNLQVLPMLENIKKGNRVWPDMP